MPATHSLQSVAEGLADLVRQSKNLDAVEAFYSPQIVSVESRDIEPGEEAAEDAGMKREMHGIDAIREKNHWWLNNAEIHSSEVDGPYLHEPNRFALLLTTDITWAPSGERMRAAEIGLYTVEEGKIVREEFFNTPTR